MNKTGLRQELEKYEKHEPEKFEDLHDLLLPPNHHCACEKHFYEGKCIFDGWHQSWLVVTWCDTVLMTPQTQLSCLRHHDDGHDVPVSLSAEAAKSGQITQDEYQDICKRKRKQDIEGFWLRKEPKKAKCYASVCHSALLCSIMLY